jgi:hypothetical protein
MKQTLRNFIADGKTKQALDQLRQLHIADTDLSAEVVQLAARFSQYERQQRMGVEDPSVLGIELRKINSALLSVIDRLDERSGNLEGFPNVNPLPNLPPQGFSWTKWTGLTDVKSWIAVAAGIAGIMTFYFKYCGQESNEGKPINTTVFVENKNHQLVLQQQGKIIMEVAGGESKEEDIDSKGSASFKNVKVGDKVRLKVNFSEPYHPIDSNALHTITADGRITLTVALQNLNRVFGTVIYRDQPLSDVLVAIGDLRATTDVTGSYKIQIPEQDQRKEQEVKFLKAGYKMLIKKAFPQTNEPLNIVMEK